jgi:hypothetical protein
MRQSQGCKSIGLRQLDTVDLSPHWRKQNHDAVCSVAPPTRDHWCASNKALDGQSPPTSIRI